MGKAIYETNKDIPKEMILGNLMLMSLRDMRIEISSLMNIFRRNNIDTGYIKLIHASDAYRRATSSVKGKIIRTKDNSKVKLEVDEIGCNDKIIKRAIGIKRIDSQAEDINYGILCEAIFDRQTKQITVKESNKVDISVYDIMEQSQIDHICNEIERSYIDKCKYHDKDTIRNIVVNIVTSTHPIQLMQTRICKFVPRGSTELIYNLKSALEEMSSYTLDNKDNIVDIIPIIDTEDQRQTVQTSYEKEIRTEMFNLTQELKDILVNKQELSTKTARSYMTKFLYLKKKADEYSNLLDIYNNAIYSQLQEAVKLINDNSIKKTA